MARLPGVKCGGDTGVWGAAVLLVANGILWTVKPAAGSGKDCGGGQGCTLPGRGFLRLVGWQYQKINYSRLPHPHTLRFRVWMFRMHGPQWKNTRIILTDVRYPAIDAFHLVREWVATEMKTWISCRLMWWKSTGKGTVNCALLWMRSMIFRPGCRGQSWGRYWCMWGWRFILAKMIGIKNNKIRIKN